MTVAVVCGNPKPASRTLAAAEMVAGQLTGRRPDVVVDVVTLGAGLLGWGDAGVAQAVADVRAAALAVVASPTYKGAYTGVLKAFLDQFPTDGLAGVTAVPVMLGAGPGHAMAPDLVLKPVLVELGATCPTKGLYLLEGTSADPASLERWLPVARAQVEATTT